MKIRRDLRPRLGGGETFFPLPAGYSTPALLPAFTVIETSEGFATTFDFDGAKPTGYTVYYVDPVTGNDANAGTDPDLPLKTIFAAIGKAGDKEIRARPGLYPYKDLNDAGAYASKPTYSCGNRNLATNCIFTVWGDSGTVVSSMHIANVVWTFDGVNNWYTASFTDEVGSCFDAAVLDAYGLYTPLLRVLTQAEVTANGRWHFNYTTGVMTVRTVDGRAPDNNLRCYLNTRNLRFITDNKILWGDGWAFEGGAPPAHLVQTATGAGASAQRVYLRNGWARYSTELSAFGGFGTNGFASTDTIRSRGDALTVLFNYYADHGFTDGFDHDAVSPGLGRTFLEYNCQARSNGRTTVDDNNQGFTAHDGSKGVRVSCHSENSKGPNYQDVTASLIRMVGCTSYSSRAAGVRNADFALGVSGADNSRLWLEYCTCINGGSEATNALYTVTSASGTVARRGFQGDGKPESVTGTTLSVF